MFRVTVNKKTFEGLGLAQRSYREMIDSFLDPDTPLIKQQFSGIVYFIFKKKKHSRLASDAAGSFSSRYSSGYMGSQGT